MNVFSIADLESYTNIKAHTIRIWESRYGILKPKRGNGNVRYYSDEDLKILLNVAYLLDHGKWRISQIAQMSEDERNYKVLELAKNQDEVGLIVQELTVAMLTFDEPKFNMVLNNCYHKWGFDETISNTIGEFLNHIGILWQASAINPAHEHFISNLIRQKLFAACDAFEPIHNLNSAWILYLPEHEMHELGLLYMHYYARLRGKKTIYLGQSVPFQDLSQICTNIKIEGIISFFTTNPEVDEIPAYVKSLSELVAQNNPDGKVLLGGFLFQKVSELESFENVKVVSGLKEVKSTFTELNPEQQHNYDRNRSSSAQFYTRG